MTQTPQAYGRLALIALVGGILQLTAVSQMSIFGQPADLTPLLVASVGFLAGSVPGAVFGFGLGLFMDTALLQTLGVESLIYTAVAAAPTASGASPCAGSRSSRTRPAP